MKKISKYSILFLLAGFVFACENNEEEPYLELHTDNFEVKWSGGEFYNTVFSNEEVSVFALDTWCKTEYIAGRAGKMDNLKMTIKPNTAAKRTTEVTVTAGDKSITFEVIQKGGGVAPPPPTHAASTQTWQFGDQTWSDAIHLTSQCDKTDFSESNTTPDCRKYSDGENTWYYYNWLVVNQQGAELCPTPWRVPSQEDFIALRNSIGNDQAGRDRLIAAWGFGGYAGNNGVEGLDYGHYWSSTPSSDENKAYWLHYNLHGYTPTLANEYKMGFQVRCVNE